MNNSNDGLTGHVVVITGGGSGIGRAAALGAARRGARVAVLDRDEDRASAVANEAEALGARQALAITCDVSHEEAVADAMAQAAELGPVHGLVTSAGIDIGCLVHEMSLLDWNRVIGVNLTGTFLCCKYALTAMVNHGMGGSVVCLSSPWAERSAPGGASAYCASKGGVSALVRSLALDYARHGIRVNAVVPGATETELMWANVAAAEVGQMRQRIGHQLALGRLAQPEEIATGIMWLLGKESRYATGSQLVIDGGLMAKGSIEC